VNGDMTAFSPLADANEEFIITPNVPNRSLPYLQGVASPASVVYEGTCGSSLSKNAFSASFSMIKHAITLPRQARSGQTFKEETFKEGGRRSWWQV
jgi:hypothetical protein